MSYKDISGLTSRANADGSMRWYWTAGRKGYRPSAVRLHGPDGEPINFDDPAHLAHVKDICERLQAEMLETMTGRSRDNIDDGTLRYVLDKYENDHDSPINDLRESTRGGYREDVARLRRACGDRQRAALHRQDFKRWYDAALKPKADGKPQRMRSARGLMVMLKVVMNFGASEEIPHCTRLRAVLSLMRFKTPKPRKQRPTYEQAKAVIHAARDAGCVSVALGTALQFEGMLRQFDVTGIWETLAPGEAAAIVLNGKRWSGITWGDITDGVLRWETPKRDRNIEIDLSLYPLITEAISLVPQEKRIGPLVVDKRSGLPYAKGAYSKRWREIANKAGLPKEIWNRDFRAGGVTDARNAGANIEDVAKHAAHSDPSFTARVYDRGTLDAARRVAKARDKSRGGK